MRAHEALRLRDVASGTLGTAVVVVAATALAGERAEELIDHDDPAPYEVNADGVRETTFAERLVAERPDVVFLGSSIVGTAVNADLFESIVGRPALDLTIPGGMSATWYLLMKNVIAKAEPPPKMVVLGFRMVYLTVPEFRATGRYTHIIDRYVDGPEPLLNRRAYLHELSALDVFARRHWAPYQKRDDIKEGAEEWAVATVGSALLGRDHSEMRAAVEAVFAEDRMMPEKVNAAQLEAEQVDNTRYFDFETEKNRSFLPEIVRIAEESGIELVLVRMRTRYDAESAEKRAQYPEFIRELLPGYERRLDEYLDEEGVTLLDFTEDERIPLSWFANGDHLNYDVGRTGFTRILAEELGGRVRALE